MKRLSLTLAALIAAGSVCAFAQNNAQEAAAAAAKALMEAPTETKEAAKPKHWNKQAIVKAGFTNTMLKNWAAGGYNSVTLASSLDCQANYAKDLMTWNNRAQLDYGFLYSSDKPIIQKNKDRMYLVSNWGYKTGKDSKWSYTANFDFNSQFSNTYQYVNPGGEDPTRKDWIDKRKLKSGLFAPAYTNLGLGIKWVPKPWFTANIAPLTGGFTIVKDPSLRKTYGMVLKPEFENAETKEPEMYKMARFQFGAQVTTNVKVKINDAINFETNCVLFSDYLNKPQNLRVNWDNKVSWKIAKYFDITLQTWMIYDPNVMIDGKQQVQFKEFLNFNFAYTFKPKK